MRGSNDFCARRRKATSPKIQRLKVTSFGCKLETERAAKQLSIPGPVQRYGVGRFRAFFAGHRSSMVRAGRRQPDNFAVRYQGPTGNLDQLKLAF